MFNGRHFDQSIILLCVRWYLAYNLSLRDLEEMMAERGIRVDHSTIRPQSSTIARRAVRNPGRMKTEQKPFRASSSSLRQNHRDTTCRQAASRSASYLIGEMPSKFLRPVPDRLVGNDDAAGRQHVLEHAQAKRKAEVEPNCQRRSESRPVGGLRP